ncbi:PqqD family protein [Carboxylicivirga sp. M1479]|uniref:PqqD family protein n=1 Tax=Carboxylicivirga sp. M1479 TaxID=2594476 RepID=UPI001178854B|nr:PqqD family protein [Carboxylicivirga sp. M1479]TRX63005.1 PqqD family protein [Carboxylicivirga sp. M1479]
MGKQLYKKQIGFVEKNIGEEMVIVPLVGSVAQMEKVFSLNELGSFIYKNLSNEQSAEALVSLIINEFDIDDKTAMMDLEQFLEKAVNSGIIIEITN